MDEKQLSPLEKKINDWTTQHLTRIPFVQKMFFIEHLRVMIGAGLSLMEALEVLAKEIENKKLQLVIAEVRSDVSQGKQLSDAMKKHPKVFPPMYMSMIEAGEIAGKLEESLHQVEIQMKKSHELASNIRGAMIYPGVVLTAMGGVGILMATVVLPKLITVFEEFDAELPLMTRILIAVIKALSNPWILSASIIGFVAAVGTYVYFLKRSSGFRLLIHKGYLHLPIAGGIIKKINLARFSLTLSSLLKSTIPIIDATEITAATCGNVLYRDTLLSAAKEIQTGRPLSEVLGASPALFPAMVTQMVMVGERSGEIERLLEELANFYSEEVSKIMKNFSTIIEPVIIVALGIAVAIMAVAVIMPMYTLVQNF